MQVVLQSFQIEAWQDCVSSPQRGVTAWKSYCAVYEGGFDDGEDELYEECQLKFWVRSEGYMESEGRA